MTIGVFGSDRFAELAGRFECFDVTLELGPTGKSIVAGKLELGGGQGGCGAGAHEVLGVVAEMAEIGAIGKLHGEIPSSCPVSACSGEGVSHKTKLGGWASTLSADRMRPSRWS